MVYTRNISDSVVWVGGSDRRLHLFENLFPILGRVLQLLYGFMTRN